MITEEHNDNRGRDACETMVRAWCAGAWFIAIGVLIWHLIA